MYMICICVCMCLVYAPTPNTQLILCCVCVCIMCAIIIYAYVLKFYTIENLCKHLESVDVVFLLFFHIVYFVLPPSLYYVLCVSVCVCYHV